MDSETDSTPAECGLPACHHDEAPDLVPDDPVDVIESLRFLTEEGAELPTNRQNAAWRFSLKLAETPLHPDQQEIADEIIRQTYEQLITKSPSRLRFIRPIFAGGFGEAMLRRDGKTGPIHRVEAIGYFERTLYPEGPPVFPGKD